MRYEKKLIELKKDKEFMLFAEKEFKERKEIHDMGQVIFGFIDNFEEDLNYNAGHYIEQFDSIKMIDYLFSLPKKEQDKIIGGALKNI